MTARAQKTLLLLSLAAPLLAGCGRNIVRASSPSVAIPPPVPRSAASSTVAAEPIPAPEIPQPAAELAPAPAIEPVPPRPKPAPAVVEAEAPRPTPAVAAPQISPILTPANQDRLKRLTTDDITTAEHNQQFANGRRLSALQKDLQDKIKGFLAQAHEAIGANDWVRAQNLAEKARVLSAELLKSL